MAYQPTQWARGDVVTSAKLNKLENGVKATGELCIVSLVGSGAEWTADKTFAEILAAFNAGNRVIASIDGIFGELFYYPSDEAQAFFGNVVTVDASYVTSYSINIGTYQGQEYVEVESTSFGG